MFPISPFSVGIQIFSNLLSYGNSCVNPILYAFLSEPFRRGFCAVVSCIRPSGPHGLHGWVEYFLNYTMYIVLQSSFFQKVRFVFQISPPQKKNIPKNYPQLEIWILFSTFKFRIAFWNIFTLEIGKFEKHIVLSEKSHL